MKMPANKASRGQALVEFAIVIPVLLLMMLALFDGGRAVIYYTELTNASRVGARVAMVNQSGSSTCGGSEQTYKCAAAEIATATGITADSVPDAVFTDGDGNVVDPATDAVCQVYSSCLATVSASYSFSPITPIVSELIGPLVLQASTTMAIERTYASS